MTFLFKRKQYDPFIPDDIENKIIELDDLEIPPPIPYIDYNEHDDFSVHSFKNIHDIIVQGFFIMTIGGLCICFIILSLLYPFI